MIEVGIIGLLGLLALYRVSRMLKGEGRPPTTAERLRDFDAENAKRVNETKVVPSSVADIPLHYKNDEFSYGSVCTMIATSASRFSDSFDPH